MGYKKIKLKIETVPAKNNNYVEGLRGVGGVTAPPI